MTLDLSPAIAGLLDALPLAVAVTDDQLRIDGWNEAAEVLYGHPRDQVVGTSVLEALFTDEDQESAAELLESVRRNGTAWEGVRRVRRSDGHLLVTSFRAQPLPADRLVWIATDGMDQGLAEQERSVLLSAEHAARRMSEEALGLVEAIVTSAPVGIAFLDLELRYVRVNDAFASLSGVPAADHIGATIGHVVPLPEEVTSDLRLVLETESPLLGRAVQLIDPQGGLPQHFSVSYYPVRTTSGQLIGAGATLVDVTEEKRLEAERAALLAQAEDAQQRLAIRAAASTVLTTTMNVDELLDRLARVLTPGAADWCIIEVFGPTARVEHVAVSHHDRGAADELVELLRRSPIDADGGGPIAQVLAGAPAQLLGPDFIARGVADAARDRGLGEIAGGFSLRSSVIVPIEAHDEVLGVLVLSTEGERLLNDDDLDLAVEIAHRAALALGNARAFQQEHQIAESLQRALLPSDVQSVQGIDFAVRYLAATDGASVGGDWYDVVGFDDGTVGVVVGDVVGHDIAASSAMGQLRSALRAFAYEDHSRPSETLARIDRLFEPLGLTYATCVLGVLDPVSRAFTWSNAGHPPPLVLRGGQARFLEGSGPFLGVTGGSSPHESSVVLEDGDFLVLYTDGLIERRDEAITEGLAQLVDAAAGSSASSAREMCTQLLSSLLPSGAARNDDVAILVARVGARVGAEGGHELRLQPNARSIRQARQFTIDVLRSAGWNGEAATAELLVSEVTTNALRYGTPPYTVHIDVADDHVEIGVSDANPRLPTVVGDRLGPQSDRLAESGRGLALVTALASRWGTRSEIDGKTVWFTLDRSSTHLADSATTDGL
ncbi:MAG TPA: SpoIIE family protein phosphatase [Acidimicrobiales bacterium]|nr:SpoIIE family protein phosphatase [Acidimicrobiales bacterium]